MTILETTLTDYMYQEMREEEHLTILKTALTHRCNDSRTTLKITKEDLLQPSEKDTVNKKTNRMVIVVGNEHGDTSSNPGRD